MCFESSWDESRYARSTENIRVRFRRNQITFEIWQVFIAYIVTNVCVLEHVINVVNWFSSAKHFEEKKEKNEEEEKEDFWSFENRTKRDKQRKTRFKRLTKTEKRIIKKEEKKDFDLSKIEQITKNDEERDSDNWRELKEKEKRREELEEKKKKNDKDELKEKEKKMIKMNKKKKKMIWRLIWTIKSTKKDSLLDDRRYDREREFFDFARKLNMCKINAKT